MLNNVLSSKGCSVKHVSPRQKCMYNTEHCGLNRIAMGEPHSGGTAYVITVSPGCIL